MLLRAICSSSLAAALPSVCVPGLQLLLRAPAIRTRVLHTQAVPNEPTHFSVLLDPVDGSTHDAESELQPSQVRKELLRWVLQASTSRARYRTQHCFPSRTHGSCLHDLGPIAQPSRQADQDHSTSSSLPSQPCVSHPPAYAGQTRALSLCVFTINGWFVAQSCRYSTHFPEALYGHLAGLVASRPFPTAVDMSCAQLGPAGSELGRR